MADKNFYTEQLMISIKASCVYYDLDADDKFWETPAEDLCKICNGAGPERWSLLKRTALTTALKRYEAAFAIHDADYLFHIISQKEADKRLRKNMLKIWAQDYGLFRWFKREARVERFTIIPAVYAVVAIAGNQAYEETAE